VHMRVLLCPSEIQRVDCGRDESMSERDTGCCADLRRKDSEDWPRPRRWRATETGAAPLLFCLSVQDLRWVEDKIRLIDSFPTGLKQLKAQKAAKVLSVS
jgi:hypothetical protein